MHHKDEVLLHMGDPRGTEERSVLAGAVAFAFPREWELRNLIEVSCEEDGHCSNGEKEDGHPETDLVDHLADQYPALSFRSNVILLPCALSDYVTGIHTFLDLRGRVS